MWIECNGLEPKVLEPCNVTNRLLSSLQFLDMKSLHELVASLYIELSI
jgi:hypothetical protein